MTSTYNTVVTAAIALIMCLAGAMAGATDLDGLFTRLADPDEADWRRVEQQIQRQMNLSGSASADLLLRRGQQALEEGDYEAAIDHLTALTDHAPDFAEGWNTRAAAYFAAGLYGPAINDLRQVLVLEPRHYGALAGLGMILEEIGNPEAALAAYREAAAIHPHLASLQAAVERLERAAGGSAL